MGNVKSTRVGLAMWVVRLRGEHDVSTAPELRRHVAAIHEHPAAIVFDLSRVSFIESRIIGVIANAADRAEHRHANAVLVVAPTGSLAWTVLGHCRLDCRVPVYEDVDSALLALFAADDGEECVPLSAEVERPPRPAVRDDSPGHVRQADVPRL